MTDLIISIILKISTDLAGGGGLLFVILLVEELIHGWSCMGSASQHLAVRMKITKKLDS